MTVVTLQLGFEICLCDTSPETFQTRLEFGTSTCHKRLQTNPFWWGLSKCWHSFINCICAETPAAVCDPRFATPHTLFKLKPHSSEPRRAAKQEWVATECERVSRSYGNVSMFNFWGKQATVDPSVSVCLLNHNMNQSFLSFFLKTPLTAINSPLRFIRQSCNVNEWKHIHSRTFTCILCIFLKTCIFTPVHFQE